LALERSHACYPLDSVDCECLGTRNYESAFLCSVQSKATPRGTEPSTDIFTALTAKRLGAEMIQSQQPVDSIQTLPLLAGACEHTKSPDHLSGASRHISTHMTALHAVPWLKSIKRATGSSTTHSDLHTTVCMLLIYFSHIPPSVPTVFPVAGMAGMLPSSAR
jgi:hypothetical protein